MSRGVGHGRGGLRRLMTRGRFARSRDDGVHRSRHPSGDYWCPWAPGWGLRCTPADALLNTSRDRAACSFSGVLWSGALGKDIQERHDMQNDLRAIPQHVAILADSERCSVLAQTPQESCLDRQSCSVLLATCCGTGKIGELANGLRMIRSLTSTLAVGSATAK